MEVYVSAIRGLLYVPESHPPGTKGFQLRCRFRIYPHCQLEATHEGSRGSNRVAEIVYWYNVLPSQCQLQTLILRVRCVKIRFGALTTRLLNLTRRRAYPQLRVPSLMVR